MITGIGVLQIIATTGKGLLEINRQFIQQCLMSKYASLFEILRDAALDSKDSGDTACCAEIVYV